MLEAVGQRLREERIRLGGDQTEFGLRGGVSKNSQSSYESGKTSPSVEYLLKLAEYGVDIGYVVTGRRSDGSIGLEERLLFDMFGKLSAREREAILTMVQVLSGNVMRELPGRTTEADAFAQIRSTMVQSQRQGFRGEDQP